MIAAVSVLVVDDDAIFRALARRMLGDCGLAVVGEAETVAAGMAAASELRPDAALVDVGLPDGDGIALARELAALPWRPARRADLDRPGRGEPGRRRAQPARSRSCQGRAAGRAAATLLRTA